MLLLLLGAPCFEKHWVTTLELLGGQGNELPSCSRCCMKSSIIAPCYASRGPWAVSIGNAWDLVSGVEP